MKLRGGLDYEASLLFIHPNNSEDVLSITKLKGARNGSSIQY